MYLGGCILPFHEYILHDIKQNAYMHYYIKNLRNKYTYLLNAYIGTLFYFWS